MKIWVVFAISCRECRSGATATFDHLPSEKEIKKVTDECGGMFCIREHIIETVLNHEPVGIDMDYD